MSVTTVDEYIEDFPEPTKGILRQMYQTIKDAVPDAEESISYGLPTFKLHKKPVVYFGGFTHHLGLYATPDGHAEFEPELSKYKRGKGSVQFAIDQPLPIDLIRRIAIYRAEQLRTRSNT